MNNDFSITAETKNLLWALLYNKTDIPEIQNMELNDPLAKKLAVTMEMARRFKKKNKRKYLL